MKKVFKIGKLHDFHLMTKDKTLSNAVSVACRDGKKIHLHNLETNDLDAKFNNETGELVLTFKLNDGDFLCLMDAQGMADKKVL